MKSNHFIKGLYETHLYVEDLDRSIAFYKDVLGLEQCYYEEGRRASFFWIGEANQQMLGLWEFPKDKIDKRHFAFECDAEWVINESISWLKEISIPFRNFLKDEMERAMVFTWMPAVSIYFDDPDGHSLEFIGKLDGKTFPEMGVASYEDWLELQKQDSLD